MDAVTLPGALGEMTVLPGHTPLLSTLMVGVLRYVEKGQGGEVAVNRGFVEVLDNRITVLTETCEDPSCVDVDRAKAAAERARDRLNRAASDPSIDVARAEYALKRALARLKVAGTTVHE